MTKRQQLDDLARFNKARWEELAQAGVNYSRPMLDLNQESASKMLDPSGIMGDVSGLDVLCLASGGGQQSVAFALLDSNVTVFDLSEIQLERDRTAAEHYGLSIDIVQGDMRDLGYFDDDCFDIVYQAYSLNFVPDVRPVHVEVARVLRSGGLYRLEWSNPFTQTVDDAGWTGEGYVLKYPYVDGRVINELFPTWDVTSPDGAVHRIEGPKEFVHGFGTMLNSLAACGFVVIHTSEDTGGESEKEPGSWPHFMSVIVPYLAIWSKWIPCSDPTSSMPGG